MSDKKKPKGRLRQFFGTTLLPILAVLFFVILMLMMGVAKKAYYQVAYYYSDKYEVLYTSKGITSHQGIDVPTTDKVLACVIDNSDKLKTNDDIEKYLIKRLDLKVTPQSSFSIKRINECGADLYSDSGIIIQVDNEVGIKQSFDRNIKGVIDGLR